MCAEFLQVPEIPRWMVSCAFGRHRRPGITSIQFYDVRKALPEKLTQAIPWLGILGFLRTGILVFSQLHLQVHTSERLDFRGQVTVSAFEMRKTDNPGKKKQTNHQATSSLHPGITG